MGYVMYVHGSSDTGLYREPRGSHVLWNYVSTGWTITAYDSPSTMLLGLFDGAKSDNLKELIENSIAWAIGQTLQGDKDRFLMIEELQALLANEKLMKELEDGQG